MQQMVKRSDIQEAIRKINDIEKQLSENVFVEMAEEIHGIALAQVSNSNALFLGDPGVGKSFLVIQWAKRILGGKYFEWLIDAFTVPEQIAGHISLKKLQEDVMERNIENTICDATHVFLDEIWKGNNGVINFLLRIMNERKYYNNNKAHKAPILVLVGASNEIPEAGDHLEAAYDRFVLKYYVNTIVEDSNWIKMMDNYLSGFKGEETTITIDEIKLLQEAARLVEIPLPVKRAIVTIKNSLEVSHGIRVSPRVINNSLRIIQAQALLSGKDIADEEDLEVLRHTLWKDKDEANVIHREILKYTFPDKEKLANEETLIAALQAEIKDFKLRSTSGVEDLRKLMGLAAQAKDIKSRVETIKRDLFEKKRSTKSADTLLQKCTSLIRLITDEIGS